LCAHRRIRARHGVANILRARGRTSKIGFVPIWTAAAIATRAQSTRDGVDPSVLRFISVAVFMFELEPENYRYRQASLPAEVFGRYRLFISDLQAFRRRRSAAMGRERRLHAPVSADAWRLTLIIVVVFAMKLAPDDFESMGLHGQTTAGDQVWRR
jgi:hypothetical protein